MKDHSKLSLGHDRPKVSTQQAVSFCLSQLSKCKRHKITDEAATRIPYEDLIGSLLLARDDAETLVRLRQENSKMTDVEWENYRLKHQVAELRDELVRERSHLVTSHH